jgi:DNA polymerase-3 subunit delta|tara:strand:+ start:3608 stop:4657 length:1050 start_codon:yes stop_codon:yes gene_type:complete
MRFNVDQLTGQLIKGLLPVYLVFGDEAMLVEENSDLIREKAREEGASERQVWHVEGRFDWSQVQWQEQTMSLFDNKRLIELRLPSGSPGKDGGEALRRFVDDPPVDTTLLIISGKIDKRSQKSKWFTEIQRVGAVIAVWPIDLTDLPRWIGQRMQHRGLKFNPTIPALITDRVEGNLYAAAQEIEKLVLLCPDSQVSEELVLASVADNARFQAFGLMEIVFNGHAAKIPRVILSLKSEGVDILAVFSAVLWSLHRMVDMSTQLEQGANVDQVFGAQKPPVWDKSKSMIRDSLARHDARQWKQFLCQMSEVDQAAKGSLQQCPWALLEVLCLNVAGVDLHGQNKEFRLGY